ncbi:MAG TPA: hypothetical protein DDX99_04355 [Desulfofustis sp.]|nr:hypothetical protein [Desulfofustis sp.]
MLCCYLLCFFGGSGDHGAAGTMIGFAKECAGLLMRVVARKVFFWSIWRSTLPVYAFFRLPSIGADAQFSKPANRILT